MYKYSLISNRGVAATLLAICAVLVPMGCGDYDPFYTRSCAPVALTPGEIGLFPGDPPATVSASVDYNDKACKGALHWWVDSGPELTLTVLSSTKETAKVSVQANKPPSADAYPWHPTGAYEETMRITADCGNYTTTAYLKVYVSVPNLQLTWLSSTLNKVDADNYQFTARLQCDILTDKSSKQYTFNAIAKLLPSGGTPSAVTAQKDTSSAKSATFTITQRLQKPAGQTYFDVDCDVAVTALAADSAPLQKTSHGGASIW